MKAKSFIKTTIQLFIVITVIVLIKMNALESAVLRYISLDELTLSSDIIFEGEVTGVETGWTEEPKHLITTLTIRIDNVLKNNDSGKKEGDKVELRLPGGHKDGMTMFVVGGPRLYKGEKVLLFLERDTDHFMLNGFTQGKFSIQTDESGNKVLIRDLSGASLIGVNPDDEFLFEVQDYGLIVSIIETATKKK